MKKIFVLLVLPLLGLAQFNFIPISSDYATFYSTDTSSFVQVYLSVYQGNLQYNAAEDSSFVASFYTELQISENDSIIRRARHKYQNTSRDTSKLKKFNQFVDVYSLDLPFGAYDVSVTLTDLNSELKGERNFVLQTKLPQEQFYFSDVELCTKIKSDTGHTMFNKNGLYVVPNPSAIYDAINPLFYYYIELNNLSFAATKSNMYKFQYFFTNSDGDTLRKKPEQTKKVIAARQVELGGMNVIALPAGNYIFHVLAKDLSSGVENHVEKAFRVYKPQKKKPKQRPGEEVAEYYIGMTKEQLEEEFNEAIYLSNKQEKNIFKGLQEIGAMQRFLTQFWIRRDVEQNLAIGSFRRLYLKRVAIANDKYGSMSMKGWKSDMGRVFIIYGEPDEYERNPNSVDMLPHVIWYYHNLEGGSEFVFADESGFGQYRLIHSSYRKELQNPNWQNVISKNAGTGSF